MKIPKIITALTCLILGIMLVADTAGQTEAVSKSIGVCLTVIVPSLFAFMALSTFITTNGIHKIIFKPLYFILKPVLRFNQDETAIFLLSVTGGYPVGVKLLGDRVKADPSYTERASHMLMYCYCGSPVFMIALAGSNTGMYVWLSNVLACFVFAVIANIGKFGNSDIRCGENKVVYCAAGDRGRSPLLVHSVVSAGSALYRVCLMVILFGVIVRIAEFTGIMELFGNGQDYFRALLEISNLTALKPRNLLGVSVISGLASLGGVCVMFQVAAISAGRIKLRKFLISRIPIALFSGVICRIILIFTADGVTAGTGGLTGITASVNPVASVCLLIMTGILLVSYRE